MNVEFEPTDRDISITVIRGLLPVESWDGDPWNAILEIGAYGQSATAGWSLEDVMLIYGKVVGDIVERNVRDNKPTYILTRTLIYSDDGEEMRAIFDEMKGDSQCDPST